MAESLSFVKFPELVFGIAGAIGVDVDAITETIEKVLLTVGYISENIKLTKEMRQFAVNSEIPHESDFYSDTKHKMDCANEICSRYKDRSAMAKIGIRAIHNLRRERNKLRSGGNPEAALHKVAYVMRQLKRPQEVDLLRKVYGRQFILVSAYGPLDQRRRIIESRLKKTLPLATSSSDLAEMVEYLIARDASEDTKYYGQHLRDTFHLADVFVDGIDKREMKSKLDRFVSALFGRNDIAPSKSEYGMYAARSAALRSSDLSRQVGAAIITLEGEIISQGCNEVPKAFGGAYWDLENPDFRDVRLGSDPNEVSKRELLRDLFERLSKAGMLSESAHALGAPTRMVEALTRKGNPDDPEDKDGPLVGSEVLDLTEYGRVVHAEMCAICDAARLGRSIKDTTLYCTTFPCHNCTKHIIAAGIREVVYMEPYPKSRAKDLHEHEIEIERRSDNAVAFLPFLGISPFRYRDIFQKGRRKNSQGNATDWYYGEPRPMIDIVANSYILVEPLAFGALIGNFEPSNAPVHGEATPKSRSVSEGQTDTESGSSQA